MRQMILCALVVVGFLNSGFGQSTIKSERISVKAYDSNEMVELFHLKGEKALSFDIPNYIKENDHFDRIVITGWIKDNFGTTTIKFDSDSEINEEGRAVCKDVKSKLTPFLGLYGTSNSASKHVDIMNIVPNTSAEIAGITADDNIIQYDDIVINNFPELKNAVLASEIGSKVILKMKNGTNEYSKSIVVGSRGEKTINYKYCEDAPLENQSQLIRNGTLEEVYLSSYPNPTNALSHVNFSSQSDENVIFSVTDVTGSLIYKEEYSNFNGNLKLDYSLENNPDGTYIFSIQQGKEIYNRKVQLAK